MGRARFLFCLPARLGVLLFSLGEFLATGFLAAVLWIALAHDEQSKNNQWSRRLLVSVIVLASISSIIAIVSFAGFVGTIFKRVGGVRAFARTIAVLLGIQFGISLLYIIMIFVEPKSDFIKQCEGGSTNSNIVNTCTNKISEVKGITVGIISAALLLHAYEVYVVGAYASELEQTEFNRNIIMGNPRYTALAGGEDSKPLTGFDSSYPYADASHSYGQKGGSYA